MRFKRKEKGKRLKTWLFTILSFLFLGLASYVILVIFEREKPTVNIHMLFKIVPANFTIKGMVSDHKSGIKNIRISLLKDGKESVLLEDHYKTKGLLQKGSTFEVPVNVLVNKNKLNITDGPATLRISARDHSWMNWFKGNQAYLEKEIVFDTKPPVLSVLSSQHNVSSGGAGLIIYKLSESCKKSGVSIGEDFFPGYSGYYEDSSIYLAFFALRFDHQAETSLFLNATDYAGNSARTGFYHYTKIKKFKKDAINISDKFLNWKLSEFQDVKGWNDNWSNAQKFIFVNSEVRKINNRKILENGTQTANKKFWGGVFKRLPNSARKANFADHRVYKYHGEVISKAVHVGIDLASVRHAEVPAANSGKIVFAGKIGIYGNMVCIDHGFGLFSLYAHLNRMNVAVGDLVVGGDIIGNTGTTGLAGGDHLHFGMFIDHVFINPVEWWDASWIKNNITDKLETVQSLLN